MRGLSIGEGHRVLGGEYQSARNREPEPERPGIHRHTSVSGVPRGERKSGQDDQREVRLREGAERHDETGRGEGHVMFRVNARPDLADTMIVRDGAPMYMRAIRINMPLCLQCHGMEEDLAPDVIEQLTKLYPDDTATGFSQGDLRGAFVVRPLPQ